MSNEMNMDEMIEVLARYRYNAKHDADRIKALEDELSRLRASSFVTAVPVEQYERLRKAGDNLKRAMLENGCHSNGDFEDQQNAIQAWNAAKEGKQS